MITLRNLTGSPYDIAPGVRLPAFGTVETDKIDALLLAALRESAAVEVVEMEDDIQYWRDTYENMTGKKPHHLWKLPRLKAEIEGYTSL